MCGIAGFISHQKQENILHEMLEIQAYRGPDDRGVYVDRQNGVHLGHNRLSIQDLSSHGHQPFVSDCGNYVIVFNGEVYNFNDIRTELEKLGYVFVSHSDTEVILYSYKEWGIKALEKCIGMFAFAVMDKTSETLVLVRDRAGVKPLYYYDDQGSFLFSSEIKSFHRHPNFRKKLNIGILPYFFQFGYIPAPHTVFENCHKLEAGHYLKYDLKTYEKTITKYWDVNDFYQQDPFDLSEKEILEDLESILEDAVNLRMVSDVPVGVFLSGGYDSSLVASLLAKKQGKRINTFTVGFDDTRFNEAEHAKSIAGYLGTNHTEYYMNNRDMLDLVQSLPFYYDEPFGDSSALPTMIVSKMARENVTVALSADGGDEAFCGYSKYFFLNKVAHLFASPLKHSLLKSGLNLLEAGVIERVNEMIPKKFRQTNIKDKFEKFKRALNAGSVEEMFLKASSYVDSADVEKMLTNKKAHMGFEVFSKIGHLDFLNQMMAIDYKTFMCDDVLTKVDRATMSVSLEGREPLLDHRIIEYMARVPSAIKYKNNQGKYLLRQVLYKYLPQTMVDKPKSGFQIPLNEWLRNDLKEMVEIHLDVNKLNEDIFDVNEIEKLKQAFFSGKESGTQIWFVLMFQMWYDKWMD